MPNMRIGALAIVACCVAGFLGCQEASPPAASPQATSVQDAGARLAAADAADGTVDHVVSKCATCRLGMDGVAQYTATYAGYEMRFCSPECKETFERDRGAVIRELPAPKS